MQLDNNEVASFLFDTAIDSITILDGLLTTATVTTTSEDGQQSTTYEYRGWDNSEEGHSNGLLLAAMRFKERDACEERCMVREAGQGQERRMFDLKLDYQEVMNAWSNKEPLYVNGRAPQTIPELRDPNVRFYSSN